MHDKDEKKAIIDLYLSSGMKPVKFYKTMDLKVNRRTFYEWIYGYKSGLRARRSYAFEEKVEAVKMYFRNFSPREICDRLEIRNTSSILNWVSIFRTEGFEGLFPKPLKEKIMESNPSELPSEVDELQALLLMEKFEKDCLRQENIELKKVLGLDSGPSQTE
jgi:transposase